jgi:hypothetical protein
LTEKIIGILAALLAMLLGVWAIIDLIYTFSPLREYLLACPPEWMRIFAVYDKPIQIRIFAIGMLVGAGVCLRLFTRCFRVPVEDKEMIE